MFSSLRPTFRDREAVSAFAGRQLTGRFYIVRHKRWFPMQTEVSRIQTISGMPEGGIVGNGLYNEDSIVARYAGGRSIALAGASSVNASGYTLGEDRLTPSPDHRPIYYPIGDIKAPQIAGRSALVPMQDR
jgi:hypothetical protein